MKGGILDEGKSTAELTRDYIDSHPSVRDCISKDLINYSSLARQIMKELGLTHEEAVLAACRRYALKLSKTDFEGQIIGIFKESTLEVKSKIVIGIAKNDWVVLRNLEEVVKKILAEKSALQIIQSSNAITEIRTVVYEIHDQGVNAKGKNSERRRSNPSLFYPQKECCPH